MKTPTNARMRSLRGLALLGGVMATVGLYRLRHPRTQRGHPPMQKPRPIGEGLWVVDDLVGYGGMPLPVRMTVVALRSGDLLLYSPTPYHPDLARRVDALGKVRHLLAPNTVHWLHVAEWQRAYPETTTWGAPGLRAREQVRDAGLRLDHDLGDAPPPAWADEFDQGIVVGGRSFRECWLLHRRTQTLLLCDLIENLEPHDLPPAMRALARMISATRATTALHVRAVLLLGGNGARASIRRLASLAPERVIMAHGRPLEDDAPRRLQRAFAWLV